MPTPAAGAVSLTRGEFAPLNRSKLDKGKANEADYHLIALIEPFHLKSDDAAVGFAF